MKNDQIIAQQRTEITKLSKKLETAQAARAAAKTDTTALTAKRDAVVEEAAELRRQAPCVETTASRLLANMGHVPLYLAEDGDGMGGGAAVKQDEASALHAKYRAITDARERAKFYAENKDKMFPRKKDGSTASATASSPSPMPPLGHGGL